MFKNTMYFRYFISEYLGPNFDFDWKLFFIHEGRTSIEFAITAILYIFTFLKVEKKYLIFSVIFCSVFQNTHVHLLGFEKGAFFMREGRTNKIFLKMLHIYVQSVFCTLFTKDHTFFGFFLNKQTSSAPSHRIPQSWLYVLCVIV